MIFSGVLLGCNRSETSDPGENQSSKNAETSDILIGVHFDETGETVYSSEDYQRVLLSVNGSVDTQTPNSVSTVYTPEPVSSFTSDEYYPMIALEPIVPVNEPYNYSSTVVKKNVEPVNEPVSTSTEENILYPTAVPVPSSSTEITQAPVTPAPTPVSSSSNVTDNPAMPIVADIGDNHLNPDKIYNFDTYDNPQNQITTDTYVLNTASHIIHYPECNDVTKMKVENKETSSKSIAELALEGYRPCGHCMK